MKAEMKAIEARMLGMRSDNTLREQCNAAPIWHSAHFGQCESELRAIARGIDNLVNSHVKNEPPTDLGSQS